MRRLAPRAGPATVSVVDALGHAVYAQQVALKAGANTVPLRAPSLAAGLYVLRVSQGANTRQINVVQQ